MSSSSALFSSSCPDYDACLDCTPTYCPSACGTGAQKGVCFVSLWTHGHKNTRSEHNVAEKCYESKSTPTSCWCSCVCSSINVCTVLLFTPGHVKLLCFIPNTSAFDIILNCYLYFRFNLKLWQGCGKDLVEFSTSTWLGFKRESCFGLKHLLHNVQMFC